MRLTWLGHSGVLVETAGVAVLADPLLRHRIGALRRAAPMPPVCRELAGRGADAGSADAGSAVAVDVVVVSHLHHDHCDLPTLRALRAPLVVVPPGAGGWLRRQGVASVVELAPGESVELDGGVRVVATPAEHLGRREPFGPTATSVGHLVEAPDRTAWLAGDTGLFAGMAGLAGLTRHGRIDVAAVPVWGWGPTLGPGHLDPDLAAEAVRRAGVARAVPVHWGTLHPAGLRRSMRYQLTTPGRRFADALARLQLPLAAQVLEVGGTLTVRP